MGRGEQFREIFVRAANELQGVLARNGDTGTHLG